MKKHMISWAAISLFVQLLTQTSFAHQTCANRYMDLMTSYTRKDPLLLKSKIGIEIEGSVDENFTYKNIAQIVRSQLVKFDPNATFRELDDQRYEISYYKPRTGIKIWTIENDQSVITRRTPFEISSPILDDPEDFKIFKKVIHSLQILGARAEPLTAGVHIHVDFDDARLGEMTFLAGVFSEIENELKQVFLTTRTRDRYTANTSNELKAFIQIIVPKSIRIFFSSLLLQILHLVQWAICIQNFYL